ncbi:Lcl C-terminal domain-containing protein [Hydrogenophaga soli]
MRNHLATLALLAAALPAWAGSLDAPAAPAAGSGMPSTTDIYNRLDTGATASVPGTFQEPAAGPTTGTGKTLADIAAKLPVPDNTQGAAAGDVANGKTFWGLRTDGTWGATSGAAAAGNNVTGTNGLLTFSIPDGFYSGGKTATAADSNLQSGNIKSGVTIFGVTGTASQASGTAAAADVLSGKTFSNSSTTGVSGTMANIGALAITPGTAAQPIPAGYHNGAGSVAGDANLASSNIKSGVTIFGVSGSSNVVDTTEAAAPATAADIGIGKKAYVNGALITGTSALATNHVSRAICTQGWGGANCDVCAGQWSGASCNVCPSGWSGINCDIIAKPFPATVPTYAGTPWKCVLDTATNLTWEVKTTGGLHDWNNTYTWYDPIDPNPGLAIPGTCIGTPGCDTAKFVATVNAEQLCGYTNWRVPTLSELQGLVVTGSSPTINSAYFPNTTADFYWSDTTYAPNPSRVGAVYFYDGSTGAINRTSAIRARLVRSGQ